MLHLEHLEGDVGCDVRVAVAVAADPGAEVQGTGRRRHGDPESLDLVVHLVEEIACDVAEDLVEVVDHRAGLVDWRRTFSPQLVGLPHQVDELGEAPLDTSPVGLRDPGIRPFHEELGDASRLGQDRTASRFGRMCREHGSELETVDHSGDDVVIDTRLEDPIDRSCDPAPPRALPGSLFVEPVRLLGHVGELEEGRKGAHDVDGRVQIRS